MQNAPASEEDYFWSREYSTDGSTVRDVSSLAKQLDAGYVSAREWWKMRLHELKG